MRGVVELERYPIDDLAGVAGRELVDRCRASMRAEGACVLPGFVTPTAIAEMVRLGESLADRAWTTDDLHTVTFEAPDPAVDPADPRARLVPTREHSLACDLLPADAPVRRLYDSAEMVEFVRQVLELDELYHSADPLDAVNIARFDPGDQLGWHFDNSHFSVTLMFQPAESGGRFEYVPRLRGEDDPNHAGVRAALDGETEPHSLALEAGTLSIFRGRYSLHRVTVVDGHRPRLNSVLTYRDRPGMTLTPETRRLFYGRDG